MLQFKTLRKMYIDSFHKGTIVYTGLTAATDINTLHKPLKAALCSFIFFIFIITLTE